MPDELDDSRFKGEVIRMLSTLINKVTAQDSRFDQVDAGFDSIEIKLNSASEDLKIVRSRFDAIGSMAIRDHQWLEDMGSRVGILESEAH
jgi:hypothetical protein